MKCQIFYEYAWGIFMFFLIILNVFVQYGFYMFYSIYLVGMSLFFYIIFRGAKIDNAE